MSDNLTQKGARFLSIQVVETKSLFNDSQLIIQSEIRFKTKTIENQNQLQIINLH